MLALTKKTDYALIALNYLAQRGGEVVSAREVSGETGVPLPILTNVLKTLAHASLVHGERGSRGGYTIAGDVSGVSLYELVTIMEGPVQFVRCSGSAEDGTVHCTLESSCPVRPPALRIFDRFHAFLKGVTLAELGVATKPREVLQTVQFGTRSPIRSLIPETAS